MNFESVFILILSIGGLAFLIAGWVIQRRNSSPFTGATMLESDRK